MGWFEDAKHRVELEWVLRGDCKAEAEARSACQSTYGEFASACTKVKLAEKRCLASHLCAREALAFYKGAKPCSDMVERFSKNIEEGGEDNVGDGESVKVPPRCRQASYELGRCLHMYTKTK